MKKKVLLFVVLLILGFTGIVYANEMFCQICNAPMHWTGETRAEWGKMFHVYECLNGHRVLVNPNGM